MTNGNFCLFFSFQKSNMKLFLAFIGLVAIAISSLAEQAKEKDDIGVVIGIDLGTTYSWWVKYSIFFSCFIS